MVVNSVNRVLCLMAAAHLSEKSVTTVIGWHRRSGPLWPRKPTPLASKSHVGLQMCGDNGYRSRINRIVWCGIESDRPALVVFGCHIGGVTSADMLSPVITVLRHAFVQPR